MKKVVYRDLLGKNPKKHEVSMEETAQLNGNTIIKKRVSKYFIKEKFQSSNIREIKMWINRERRKSVKRNFHILRTFDTATGDNRLICKVIGEIFVIHEKCAYKLVCFNKVRVQIKCSKVKNRMQEK